MPSRLLLLPLNHLLSRADWARTRLQPFTGQGCVISGPLLPALHLQVDGEGFFTLVADAAAKADAEVRIELPADLLPRLLRDGPGAVLHGAHLSGPAAFAETLGFVFRNLRWDVADDLAPIVGDVAAQRLTATAKGIISAKQAAAQRLLGNVAEFLSEEENPYLPLRRAVLSLQSGTDELLTAQAQLAQRLDALEASQRIS